MKIYVRKLSSGIKEFATAKTGRYGIYFVFNDCNYSEKAIIERGFKLVELNNDQYNRILRKNARIQQQQEKAFYEQKMLERFNQVEFCLKCQPIEISHKKGELCFTANLADTPMIETYHGCGRGTAYVNNNAEVVAWHYGYDKPSNAPAYESKRVELSGTQICFY